MNSSADRLLTLDVLRGATMAAMVVVNNPGDWGQIYAPLRHAEWHGCTLTDWIFPFFLFWVGVSIPFSRRIREAGASSRIARRVVLLFALGLFLNGFPSFELASLRIPGVLQRIALCYGIAALLSRIRSSFTLGATALALLFVHGVMLLWIGLLGAEAGDLSAEGSLSSHIDRALLGSSHLWKTHYDPEGVLGTLSAAAQTVLGLLAGRAVKSEKPMRALLALALACLAGGLAAQLVLPLNKALWTPSFALWTSGLALLLLAGSLEVLDRRRVRRLRRFASPFAALGRNAILLFVGTGIVGRLLVRIELAGGSNLKTAIVDHLFTWRSLDPRIASLGYALASLSLWSLLLLALDRRKLYWKV